MKILKVLGGGIAALLVLVVVGVAIVKSKAESRLARTWPEVKGVEVPVPWPLSESELTALREEKKRELGASPPAAAHKDDAAPSDAAQPVVPDPLAGVDLAAVARERALARGQHLLRARVGCAECHGEDFGGKVIMDAPPMGRWVAPNITAAGVTKNYTAADWDRIVRHGIKQDGTSATMPAIDHAMLSDQELSDLIVAIRAKPAVERASVESTLGPLRAVLIVTGGIPVSAEVIDHTAMRAPMPPPAVVDVKFGAHVAGACVGCHRMNFSGGPIEGGDPNWPEAGNLTPDTSGLKGWTDADFRTALREGKSKDGRALHPIMPVGMTKNLSDMEVDAMFAYFQSLPPLAKGAH